VTELEITPASDLVCPQCREPGISLETLECPKCNWQGTVVDGIPVLLSEKGKNDPLFNRYTQIYDQIASDDLDESIMDQDYVRVLARHTAKMLGENLTGKKGCDIGSGKGLLIDQLIERGAQLTAVDIAMSYLKRLKEKNEGLECILANAEELPFHERFDFVTCTDVMEHVLNVGNFLYCLNEAIVPGGIAVIRVPYRENLLGYATHLGCNYDLVHLRNFTEQSLKDEMIGAGFRIDTVSYGGFSLSMRLPRDCDGSTEKTSDTIKIRTILQNRGITYEDLEEMPEWFAKQISRSYIITVLVQKTHRIERRGGTNFELVPID